MYADDLILLSISLSDLQYLVNICVTEFRKIGMHINTTKSACIRVGLLHNIDVHPILIDSDPLSWKQEIRYLGITVASGRKFTVNLQNTKQKFFRALNGIFGKIGVNSSPHLICSLFQSYCVPILLYAAECLTSNNSMFNNIEHVYLQAFIKIFHTF